MQTINALVKTRHKNNFIYKSLQHTFILKVQTAQHTSLAISDSAPDFRGSASPSPWF